MNYSELQAQIIATSHRADLAAQVPLFVAMAHDKIMGELEPPDALTWVTLDTSGAVNVVGSVWRVALPLDTLTVRYVYSNGAQLESWTEPALINQLGQSGAGAPARGYSVNGDSLLLAPGTSDNLNISYEKRLPMFQVEADTNWLLTNYSELYLYASLVHLYTFIQDDVMVSSSMTLYGAQYAIAKVQTEQLKGGGTPRIRSV
jgi:hypothetical protein